MASSKPRGLTAPFPERTSHAGRGPGASWWRGETDVAGHRLGSLNGERMQYTLVFNLRGQKDFYFSREGKSFLSFFVEVENLFNRRNIDEVYQATGLPDRDGNYALNVNSPTYQSERVWYELLAKDPQHYDHPRQLRLGMEFNF